MLKKMLDTQNCLISRASKFRYQCFKRGATDLLVGKFEVRQGYLVVSREVKTKLPAAEFWWQVFPIIQGKPLFAII